MSKMKTLLDVVQDMRALASSLEELASSIAGDSAEDTSTEPSTPATHTQGEKAAPTIVELRAFVAARSTPENRVKIKAILTAHGVNKLTELPEDTYAAVMQEVSAL